MPRKISMGLNSSDIDAAVHELEEYAKDLEKFAKRLNDELLDRGEEYFEDFLGGTSPARRDDIETTIERGAPGASVTGRLIATGETKETGFNILMAVEFGAGIYYNGATSRSGYANRVGMGPGTWPPKDPMRPRWRQGAWAYPIGEDASGNVVLGFTHGTESIAPMFRTAEELRNNAVEIASEVAREWL